MIEGGRRRYRKGKGEEIPPKNKTKQNKKLLICTRVLEGTFVFAPDNL